MNRFLIGLALVVAGILGCAALTLNPFTQSGVAVLGRELNTAGIILFVVALALGSAAAGVKIWKMGSTHVIRDGKGEKTARVVVYKGAVVQIGSPEGFGITELMQMQAQMATHQQKMMQVVGTSATAMQRLASLEDYYEDEDEEEEVMQIEPPEEVRLPNLVKYEDIKPYIPENHALVGVDGQGVITRGREIKALTWIVGGSGTGKTNSVCLRVEEDYQWGHWFLVIDPHWFKPDSMYNAIKGYADRFLMPVAYETEDILKVLNFFLSEFKRRKAGGSWEFPITILIDEIGSLTTDKPEDDDEKEMIDKIKQVTRICGQESRGFDMGEMCISQDAAGLAWVRKRALLVIAHQLLMMSERMLATNKNAEVSRAMDDWPKGRTLVYGIGLEEGQRVVQQPVFQPRQREIAAEKSTPKQTDGVSRIGNDHWLGNGSVSDLETASQANLNIIEGVFSVSENTTDGLPLKSVSLEKRETIKRLVAIGNIPHRDIARAVGLSGRNYHVYQSVCKEEGIAISGVQEGV